MSIRTILFDLDETLIDTNELIISSFEHTLQHFRPNEFKREDILQFIGPPLADTFKQVAPDKIDDMIEVYRAHNLEHHDELVTPFDGVVDTIKQLKEEGYQLGIVTTKIKSTAIRGLEVTGLAPYFNVIIGLDDVTNAKPDPEPVNKGMAAFGAKPEETMMIGDNHHDILSGQNAGTKTAGVAWTIKGRETLEKLNPTYMLDHISDLRKILRK
ncbi:pyrophosphatase PpaX [Salirhabdus salicampi]|uniref:pyrophosphatase PpaX n=1 Tax=Salirhabdus salicampi TaxID=476102 RepID=UPI0020C3DC27|nr:pyrophosphatase PpaX [Salirhabdus salicampi]MCP8617633.1 pyrophosphatase PpaX [Salirhabdus salicampi]